MSDWTVWAHIFGYGAAALAYALLLSLYLRFMPPAIPKRVLRKFEAHLLAQRKTSMGPMAAMLEYNRWVRSGSRPTRRPVVSGDTPKQAGEGE